MATKQVNKITDKYTSSDIEVLEGMEAVRRRPGMYIGSTDRRGLQHLIFELVDNGVDEFMAGHCSQVSIVLNQDGSVNIQDIILSINIILGGEASNYEMWSGDLNQDSVIDILDIVLLINMILSI